MATIYRRMAGKALALFYIVGGARIASDGLGMIRAVPEGAKGYAAALLGVAVVVYGCFFMAAIAVHEEKNKNRRMRL